VGFSVAKVEFSLLKQKRKNWLSNFLGDGMIPSRSYIVRHYAQTTLQRLPQANTSTTELSPNLPNGKDADGWVTLVFKKTGFSSASRAERWLLHALSTTIPSIS
jgi:hypothetical protein